VASQPDTPFSITNLSSAELNLLSMVPDEEQRSVLYRELLRSYNAEDKVRDLSIAENVLNKTALETIFEDSNIPSDDFIRYSPCYGEPKLLETLASKLSKWFGARVDSEDVFVTAGVSSAIQLIALGLQTPLPGPFAPEKVPPVPQGSKVMLPVPFWQGFNWSFKEVPKLKILPVALKDTETFQLTINDLKKVYDEEEEPKPKLLVLTNPHNPLGINYKKELLEDIYTWALSKQDMHIISDEMYRHSQIKGAQPPFVSALALNETNKSESNSKRVHVVWGFTKDFGLSGCRIGCIISKSEYVHGVMRDSADPLESRRSLAWFSPFDSLKQYYVRKMLTPANVGCDDFWDTTMNDYSNKLTDSFRLVGNALNNNGIKFLNMDRRPPLLANSAQFFWLDLREFLKPVIECSPPTRVLFGSSREIVPPPTPEQELANCILENAKVKLLTGEIMGCTPDNNMPEGYFRLCFTVYDPKIVVQAVNQMGEYLRSRPRNGTP